MEETATSTVVMSLESYGRLKTPPTGEVELRLDCKRSLLPPANGDDLAGHKLDGDVSVKLHISVELHRSLSIYKEVKCDDLSSL